MWARFWTKEISAIVTVSIGSFDLGLVRGIRPLNSDPSGYVVGRSCCRVERKAYMAKVV